MKKWVLVTLASFCGIIGCTQNQEKVFVFLVIEKAVPKDGLYFNKSDPSILTQIYSRDVVRYFSELDTGKREVMDYQQAYEVFEKRYVDSYMELFPTDLTESDPGEGMAVIIDTISKTAYKTRIEPTTRMY